MSNSDRIVLLALAALLLAAKLPTASTPYFWDEVGWIGQVHWAMRSPLWHLLPGAPDRGAFGNRPVGMFLPMAALFKVTGPSIWLAHLVIAAVAVVGVCFTFRLGALLYGQTAGLLAALLLTFSPMYFAQAGMFLADLPVTAFGVASVYWAYRRRYGRYLPFAFMLVLLKESGMAIVCAISLFTLLREWRHGPRPALREAVRWALPLLVILLYYSVQKLDTGTFFMPEHGFTILDVRRAPDQFRTVTAWLFVEQLHWLFAVLIAADLLVRRGARRRPELLLFALIVVCSGYPFSVVFFLPRYLLPVFPYLCVATAGALVSLLPRPAWHVPIAATLVLLLATRLPGSERRGTREWDLGYLDAVHAAAATAERLERAHADARIVTSWPMTDYLSDPALGYVGRPLKAVTVGERPPLDGAAADVVVDTSLGTADSGRLIAYARAHALTLVDRIEVGSFRYDIYAAAPR